MRIRRFKPRLLPTLFCLALWVVLVAMGCWQWSRAHSKELLQARYEAGMNAQPLTLQEAQQQGADIQGFPIEIQGVLDRQRHFLLDNQMQGARPGFNVLTPLHTDQGQWVLVDRGWLPWDEQRRVPLLAAPIEKLLPLRGRVYFPSARQVVLKADNYTQPDWPLLVQKIDLPAMAGALAVETAGVELAPFVIRLNPDEPVEQGEQLLRRWSWLVMAPEKHRAYAFQWFGMALTLIILFFIFSIERKPS